MGHISPIWTAEVDQSLHCDLDIDAKNNIEDPHWDQHIANHIPENEDIAKFVCQQRMDWIALVTDLGNWEKCDWKMHHPEAQKPNVMHLHGHSNVIFDRLS